MNYSNFKFKLGVWVRGFLPFLAGMYKVQEEQFLSLWCVSTSLSLSEMDVFKFLCHGPWAVWQAILFANRFYY